MTQSSAGTGQALGLDVGSEQVRLIKLRGTAGGATITGYSATDRVAGRSIAEHLRGVITALATDDLPIGIVVDQHTKAADLRSALTGQAVGEINIIDRQAAVARATGNSDGSAGGIGFPNCPVPPGLLEANPGLTDVGLAGAVGAALHVLAEAGPVAVWTAGDPPATNTPTGAPAPATPAAGTGDPQGRAGGRQRVHAGAAPRRPTATSHAGPQRNGTTPTTRPRPTPTGPTPARHGGSPPPGRPTRPRPAAGVGAGIGAGRVDAGRPVVHRPVASEPSAHDAFWSQTADDRSSLPGVDGRSPTGWLAAAATLVVGALVFIVIVTTMGQGSETGELQVVDAPDASTTAATSDLPSSDATNAESEPVDTIGAALSTSADDASGDEVAGAVELADGATAGDIASGDEAATQATDPADTTDALEQAPEIETVEPEVTVQDLPPLDTLPERGAIFRPPLLYLEGPVTEADAALAYQRAAEVVGPDNIVNNYIIRPDAPPATDGNVRVEQAVLFQTGSAVIAEQFIPILELGVQVMTLNPQATVVVEGHTDSVGTAQSNQILSERRAQAVVDYLTARGIDSMRMSAVGLGETVPVADNETDQGRQINRRIEFNLIDLLLPREGSD